jgi:cytochrome c peroxidase
MRVDDRQSVDAIFSNLGKAIAAYETKIISRDAPFDVFVEGLRDNDPRKLQAISESAKRGLKIFVGQGNCRLCHTGPNFSDGEFHSVGVGTLDGAEPTDSGRYAGIDELKASPFNAAGAFSDDRAGAMAKRLSFLTNKPDNWGQFKTPSLRNVALTAPYMHQGQFATLADVIEHYSTLADAVQIGHHREKILLPLNLSPQEKQDLEAFLLSLSSPALPHTLTVQPPSPSLPVEAGNTGSGR